MKKDIKKTNLSRRNFIKKTAVTAAGITIVPRQVLGGPGYIAPSDKLIIAGIGAGGQGGGDIQRLAVTGTAGIGVLVVGDGREAKFNHERFPKARDYQHRRELLDKKEGNSDAVSVGTADHSDAVITFFGMQLGKHVYGQKPLTHD